MDLVVNERILNWRPFSNKLVSMTYVNICKCLTYAVKKKKKQVKQVVFFDHSEIDNLKLFFVWLMSKSVVPF